MQLSRYTSRILVRICNWKHVINKGICTLSKSSKYMLRIFNCLSLRSYFFSCSVFNGCNVGGHHKPRTLNLITSCNQCWSTQSFIPFSWTGLDCRPIIAVLNVGSCRQVCSCYCVSIWFARSFRNSHRSCNDLASKSSISFYPCFIFGVIICFKNIICSLLSIIRCEGIIVSFPICKQYSWVHWLVCVGVTFPWSSILSIILDWTNGARNYICHVLKVIHISLSPSNVCTSWSWIIWTRQWRWKVPCICSVISWRLIGTYFINTGDISPFEEMKLEVLIVSVG